MSEAMALTEATLKALLPNMMCARSLISDFNEATTPGVYYTSAPMTNNPPKAPYHGILIVGRGTSTDLTLIQIFISIYNATGEGAGTLCIRAKWSGEWKPWWYLPMQT